MTLADDAVGPGSARDRFGQHIGLEDVADGEAVVRVVIGERHLNGAGIAHGGVLFAALDQAVAIVANRHQLGAVLTTGTMSCLRPAFLGDVLEATVEPVRVGRRLSLYNVTLVRDGEVVAHLLAQYYASDRVG